MFDGKSTLLLLFVLITILNWAKPQQTPEKKKVVVDIEKSLTKYLVKFYKHRLVEDQNNAIAPLLDLYVLVLLYKVSDASTKADIHTLLSIPEDAEDDTVDKFERKLEIYLTKLETSQLASFGSRLFIDSSIKSTNKALESSKFFTTSTTTFKQQGEFSKSFKNWMASLKILDHDHFVHKFNFDRKTVTLILQILSLRWKLPLALSNDAKQFRGEKVKHLEGTFRGSYANVNDLGIEVVEHTLSNSDLKLWLIQPKSMVTFINETFEGDTLNTITGKLKNNEMIKVSLPQITIEYNSEENAFIQNNFHVLTAMFSSPSLKLDQTKEDKHPVKSFLMHCEFKFEVDRSVVNSGKETKTVNFERPFTVMVLTKDTNIPLVMANHFSVTDRMREMEDEELKLAELVAKEEEREEL